MFKDNQQKGVSLIITFFIMTIILSVILSVSIFLYNQIKIIRNIGNSVVSFFAADSGVEKVLYYDRKSLPIIGVDPDTEENILAPRGLCTMYLFSQYPETACPSEGDNTDLDNSLLCEPDINYISPVPGDLKLKGCDPEICNNCTIAFSSEFANKSYEVTASVKPSTDNESTDFRIDSRGKFGNTERQIKVSISSASADEIIIIEDACANPRSSAFGNLIDIFARVSVTDFSNFIGGVDAIIKDAEGNYYDKIGQNVGKNPNVIPLIPLTCGPPDGSDYDCNYKLDPWHLKWPKEGNFAPEKAYFVSLDAYDTTVVPNHKTEYNIPFCWSYFY